MNLKPLPGHVLVELRDTYEHIATTQQKYDTRTSGICISYVAYLNNKAELDYWDKHDPRNKRVFWEEYKDGAVIEREGKKYAFIKLEDLTGYEDVESN